MVNEIYKTINNSKAQVREAALSLIVGYLSRVTVFGVRIQPGEVTDFIVYFVLYKITGFLIPGTAEFNVVSFLSTSSCILGLAKVFIPWFRTFNY